MGDKVLVSAGDAMAPKTDPRTPLACGKMCGWLGPAFCFIRI